MSNAKTQQLAEKIANLLQSESDSNEFDVLRESLEKINARLDKIEDQISAANQSSVNPVRHETIHSSQQKYSDIAAIVDKVFESKEKACTFEPNDKPCDNCSMCSSHGF